MSQASKVWIVVLTDNDEDEQWTTAHRTEQGAWLAMRAKMIAMLKASDEREKQFGIGLEPRYSADLEEDAEKLARKWTDMTRLQQIDSGALHCTQHNTDSECQHTACCMRCARPVYVVLHVTDHDPCTAAGKGG
jgi:hypothetical protein